MKQTIFFIPHKYIMVLDKLRYSRRINNKKIKKKGGSRTLRTRITEKPKTAPKSLSIDELSGKIQWLIDFAGTEHIMKHVISKFTTQKKSDRNKLERLQITGNMDPTAEYKNKIIFNTYGNGVGHWIYFSRTGEEFNSYKLEHQKPRTNQFCQSFATLYLLKDWGLPDIPDFFSRLQTTIKIKSVAKKNEIWGHNIQVIIDMWKWIFNKNSSKTWIVDEMKLINDEYIDHNNRTRQKNKHIVLISDNTEDIDYTLIENKMDDIVAHKVEIARET
jgi:hypothetical protein